MNHFLGMIEVYIFVVGICVLKRMFKKVWQVPSSPYAVKTIPIVE